MLIIYFLKMININNDQPQQTSAATHPGEPDGHLRLKKAARVQAGQRIDHRQPALVADESRHSSDRQQEHQRACHRHNRNVMGDPTGIFNHYHDRSGQRRREQHSQPDATEVLLASGRGCGQPRHRRMKCRGA